jgi:sulfur-oxidizing protein SoxY
MKRILIFIILVLGISNLNAKNPIFSPTFDDIVKQIIGEDKYIFDDKNIKMKVPNFADNPVQVPIFVDATKIKDAKRLIIFADLNPIYEILDMKTNFLLPVFSTNIKVAQETPLRALVQDKNDLWHIGSININSNGGGCDVSSQASNTNSEFTKYLGKSKGKIFDKKDKKRIKASIFHPMETGLVFGNLEYYIKQIHIKEASKTLTEIKITAAVSENPRFIFETKKEFKNLNIEFLDSDANDYLLKL